MAKRIELNGLECFLLPQKAMYVTKYELLVISDWHLGKLKHFRNAGFFVPSPDISLEIDELRLLISDLPIREIIFLGDLFHSEWNTDWEYFKTFINSVAQQIKFTLTKGNHDVLDKKHFNKLPIAIRSEYILSEGLVFSHEPIVGLPTYMLNIVGHIHPGYLVGFKGRQNFRLPCFYIQDHLLILPAFGKFTGLHMMKKQEDSTIYAIIHDEVIEIK